MKKIFGLLSLALITATLLISCGKKCCKMDGAGCHGKDKKEMPAAKPL